MSFTPAPGQCEQHLPSQHGSPTYPKPTYITEVQKPVQEDEGHVLPADGLVQSTGTGVNGCPAGTRTPVPITLCCQAAPSAGSRHGEALGPAPSSPAPWRPWGHQV